MKKLLILIVLTFGLANCANKFDNLQSDADACLLETQNSFSQYANCVETRVIAPGLENDVLSPLSIELAQEMIASLHQYDEVDLSDGMKRFYLGDFIERLIASDRYESEEGLAAFFEAFAEGVSYGGGNRANQPHNGAVDEWEVRQMIENERRRQQILSHGAGGCTPNFATGGCLD
ncbi:MAG: hypothetical protein H7A04_05550 [Pseudomonadales bacterium]|nr:hypothetical protein [Pseudomonadales bacterium]